MKEIRSTNEEERVVELQLALGECADSFNLENAVCNHGLFMMAPNQWIPSKKTLQRPLRLADSITSLTVSIQQPDHSYLLVRVHGVHHHHHLSSQDQKAILVQVKRMLRISTKDERDVKKFQNMHPQAKKRGFGRIFRSPTLFEDAIKSILLCNCTWVRTLKMSQQLCKLQQELSSGLISHELLAATGEEYLGLGRKKGLKRKFQVTKNSIGRKKGYLKRKLEATNKNSGDEVGVVDKSAYEALLGNFPSPQELAKLNVEILTDHCNLGYRATQILNFAKSIACGKLELKEPVYDYDYDCDDDDAVAILKFHEKLSKVNGFGPFACTNVLMCSGYYTKVPIDSETIRHLVQIHGRKDCNDRTVAAMIDEIYGKYSPFQCLAYWFELLEYYESKRGRLSELPSSSYGTIAAALTSARGYKKSRCLPYRCDLVKRPSSPWRNWIAPLISYKKLM